MGYALMWLTRIGEGGRRGSPLELLPFDGGCSGGLVDGVGGEGGRGVLDSRLGGTVELLTSTQKA